MSLSAGRALVAAVLVAAAALAACGGEGSSRVAPGTRVRVEIDEHLRRGIELARQGQDEGAEAEFRRCIELDGRDARPHLYLGRLLAAKSAWDGSPPDRAAAELNKAYDLAPDRLETRILLADFLKRRIEQLLSRFTAKEREALISLLRKVVQSLQQMEA